MAGAIARARVCRVGRYNRLSTSATYKLARHGASIGPGAARTERRHKRGQPLIKVHMQPGVGEPRLFECHGRSRSLSHHTVYTEMKALLGAHMECDA